MSGVLVARLDNAGDVLLAGPAVRAVAASGRPVTLLAGPKGAAAGALLHGVESIAVLRAPWIDLDPPRFDHDYVEAAVAQLRATGCDDAVILTSSHQSSLPLAMLLRIAGFARIGGISLDHAGSLLDIRVRGDPDVHEVERGLLVAAACGFPLPDDDDGSLRIRRTASSSVAVPNGAYVVLHPGGTAPARRWAPQRWAELAAQLARRAVRFVVTGAADERDMAQRLAAGNGLVLAGDTSFAELAEVIAGATCIVTANTGPAHVAAAVRTPVVCLFAPTVPAHRWRPWRVPHVLLGDQDIACAGCMAERCPVAGHPCIDDVEPEAVFTAMQHLWRASEAVA